jgi:hypothetical protein
VIAGKPYYTVSGNLPLERETQSNLNTELNAGAQEATVKADLPQPALG